MRQVLLIILVIALILLLNSCNTTEPPPPPPNGEKPILELTLEDVSCIEAWIELTTTNLQLPATIEIKQFNPTGDTLSQVTILNTQDSLLYIDSLLPNQTYQYQAYSIPQSGGQNPATSNELSVTTMDTTSHDFTFETYTFGGTAGSSTLYDVAVINENNIWAVGEIYVADTTQNGYTMYNAVHWDGTSWEMQRIPFTGSCSAVLYPTVRSIWAFSDTDIWFARGGSLVHFDGIIYYNDCNMNSMLTGSINKIWGSSKSDLYVVGNNGNIVHYNGVLWAKIESGTNLNINDIWGIADGKGGYNKYLAAFNVLLKAKNNNELISIDVESGMSIISVWGVSNKMIYTAGAGVVIYKNHDWERINIPGVQSIYRIRGDNHNNICGIGSPGSTIYHFNGYSWQYMNPNPNNRYWRIEIKENIIAASGYQGEKAAIIILRRNN